MHQHPRSIKNLIDQFTRLPGIGPKTAERLVFYLLKQDKSRIDSFSDALKTLNNQVTRCSICHNFAEKDPCYICSDPKRDSGLICIVAKPQDLLVIEKTNEFNGLYHVLGGLIDPLEGITPDLLTVRHLVDRIKKDAVNEVILALNSNMAGETTTLYLTKLLKQFTVAVSRLAQGLPIGSDLEYADEITVSSALKGRRQL